MGERTSYAPGTFCWVDLGTSDAAAATRYYSELFGWEGEEMPAGDAGTYVMFRRGEHYVAALYAQEEAQREQGVPPLWNSYVSVVDADATAERVRSLGGQVLGDPFDVLDSGRMAIVRDPAGAVLILWQPRAHFGAGVVNEPGTWCWDTLTVSDPEPVRAFYSELLGWTYEEATPATTVITLGGQRVGGIQRVPAESGIPPSWSVAFAVADIGDGHRRAVEGGGHELVPPQDVGIGHYSVVADPQGAGFGLYAGLLDP